MIIDPTMAAVFVIAAIFACVVFPLAIKGTADDLEPEGTFEAKFSANKARDTATGAQTREYDTGELHRLLDQLPLDCGDSWRDQVDDSLTALQVSRDELAALERKYKDALNDSVYSDSEYERIACSYTQVTESFLDAWQQLTGLEYALCEKLHSYSPMSVKAQTARSAAKINESRRNLTAYFELTGIDKRWGIAAFEKALTRIKVQLGQIEHRSHAVEQLAWLESELDSFCKKASYDYSEELAARCRASLRATEEGIVWFREYRPRAPRLARLYQLHERLAQEDERQGRNLTVHTLKELNAEITDITASAQIAHEVQTGEVPLLGAA